jgi:hypothetical protein
VGDQNNYRNLIVNKNETTGSPVFVFLEQSWWWNRQASGGVTYSCIFNDGVTRRYTARCFF